MSMPLLHINSRVMGAAPPVPSDFQYDEKLIILIWVVPSLLLFLIPTIFFFLPTTIEDDFALDRSREFTRRDLDKYNIHQKINTLREKCVPAELWQCKRIGYKGKRIGVLHHENDRFGPYLPVALAEVVETSTGIAQREYRSREINLFSCQKPKPQENIPPRCPLASGLIMTTSLVNDSVVE
ncbi:hypothetical protein HPG69_019313 [Diceros bicornis minor]|uniref:Uncharacterized protein n=1 Tax=Diceros bicornis minor TaxID=77932 RepID=A0A7J7FMK5_DICBM|nr:hypothetical protein HPG69_019313 [Diceros bicornis minor]